MPMRNVDTIRIDASTTRVRSAAESTDVASVFASGNAFGLPGRANGGAVRGLVSSTCSLLPRRAGGTDDIPLRGWGLPPIVVTKAEPELEQATGPEGAPVAAGTLDALAQGLLQQIDRALRQLVGRYCAGGLGAPRPLPFFFGVRRQRVMPDDRRSAGRGLRRTLGRILATRRDRAAPDDDQQLSFSNRIHRRLEPGNRQRDGPELKNAAVRTAADGGGMPVPIGSRLDPRREGRRQSCELALTGREGLVAGQVCWPVGAVLVPLVRLRVVVILHRGRRAQRADALFPPRARPRLRAAFALCWRASLGFM